MEAAPSPRQARDGSRGQQQPLEHVQTATAVQEDGHPVCHLWRPLPLQRGILSIQGRLFWQAHAVTVSTSHHLCGLSRLFTTRGPVVAAGQGFCVQGGAVQPAAGQFRGHPPPDQWVAGKKEVKELLNSAPCSTASETDSSACAEWES